jgi:TonB family protein
MLREFQVDRVLGEGGFSVVYLATDTRLERQVAIKEYMPTALATRNPDLSVHVRSSAQHREAFDAGLRSFINEAKLLARFEHRALVKVHQFWQEKGTAYMVMPYYSGPTLKNWVRQQHDPVDPGWLEQFLRLMMDAVETLHRENCLHRDVAPDNILILNERTPLLLDFGAARRVIGDLTQALTVILKPGFAPIEQYAESQSMRQGPWTDVYALCAVAHFMITGRAPTPSVTRVLADDLVPLRAAAEGRFPPAFLGALDAGLTVRPQQRPQTIAALRELMNGAPLEDTLTAPPAPLLSVVLPPASVSKTVRPPVDLTEPLVTDDDDKTRIVTTRDLPVRTASQTISSPSEPAMEPVASEAATGTGGEPSFGSRFPSRSMREHEASVTAAPVAREEDDDKDSRLPLIIGGVAIAAVIGGAWGLISWMDNQAALSRQAPAASPAPAPAPSSAVAPPVVTAAAPAPPSAPVPAPAPAPAPTPAPAPATAPPPAGPVAAAPATVAPAAPPPAAPAPAPKQTTAPPAAPPSSEPVRSEKAAGPAATRAEPQPSTPAAAKPAGSPPASTKPQVAPTQTAAAASTAASPAKSAAPSETRPPAAMASKGGPPSGGDPARATAASPGPQYTTPSSPPPAAPQVSVPSVATVDASPPPPQVAAVEPTRPAPPPAPTAPPRALSAPKPPFPREAIRANVDKGRVVARLHIAADGSVNRIEIVSARPARLFEREVRETAMRWRYEPPGQPTHADVTFDFDLYAGQ